MPGTDEERPVRPNKAETLSPMESVIVSQIHAGQQAIVAELKELRREIRDESRAGARTNTLLHVVQFAIILFLAAGVMLIRGVDPERAANATTTVVESAGVTTTVETKKTEPEVGAVGE